MLPRRRWPALGGVVGPLAFLGAWSVLGTGRPGYSPVHDPISRLAAVDASSRAAMTGGFLAFGLGVSFYAAALRTAAPGGAALAAAMSAAATVAVAAFPLGSNFGDRPHAVAAGVAYAALAATPLLGARAPAVRGHRRAAALSLAAGAVAGTALFASVVTPHWTGLLQRTGLTVGDAWIVGTAVWLLRRDVA